MITDPDILDMVANSQRLHQDLANAWRGHAKQASVLALAKNPKNWKITSQYNPEPWPIGASYEWGFFDNEYDATGPKSLRAFVLLVPDQIEDIMYFILSDMTWIAHSGGDRGAL